jgi:phosphoribosyl 1,2-cyclic phosphate phosphodiesterase
MVGQPPLRVTLLGTGSSGGVPRVTGDWGACDPNEPRNRRRRCSALVECFDSTERDVTTVLIDTGPDCREQLLAANVQSLDGVLITHPHADHIFGMDDLRQMALSLRRPIDVFMDDNTERTVMGGFHYCFKQAEGSSYPSFCVAKTIDHAQVVTVEGPGGILSFTPFSVEHGDIHALGFRIGDIAYVPDMKRLSNEHSESVLAGVNTLVVDALRRKPHPSHMHLTDTLEFIEKLKPERAVLTNMYCDLDYDTLLKELPPGVEPGYDGMVIESLISSP